MIHKNERYPGYGKWLWMHSTRYKMLTIVYVLTVIISSIASIYISVYIGRIIDIILQETPGTLTRALIFLVIFSVLSSGMHALFNILACKWAYKNEFNIRNELFQQIQNKSIEYHNAIDSGQLMSLTTNDVDAISSMYIITTNLIHNVSSLFFIVVITATQLNFILICFFIPFVPFIIVTFKKYRQTLAPYTDRIMQDYSELSSTLQDSISGVELVRNFTMEKAERNKFHSKVSKYKNTWIGQNLTQAKYYPTLITDIAVGSNFLLAIYFANQHLITIGVFIAVNMIFLRIRGTLNSLHQDWYKMELALSASSRIFKAINGDSELEKSHFTKIPDRFKGKIEFRNVTFFHKINGNTHPVLQNISFIIEPSERVALVGPTGCGKTTIAKLLLRFYKPQKGEILIDDENIEEYPLAELRKRLGYIEQDIYLFPRTIKENIKFGKPEANMDDIIEVAHLSESYEFIKEMPQQFDTMVGDRGVRLSGGQRQRIAIARALLVNPPILILDDASSAIDSKTEEKIVRSMETIMQNRTTIVITHRLHAIRVADKIILIKKGKIAAQGNHYELLKKSVDYRRIFGNQLNEEVIA